MNDAGLFLIGFLATLLLGYYSCTAQHDYDERMKQLELKCEAKK